jgi:immune inhibitor A
MKKALFKGFAVLMIMALLAAVIPVAVSARPPEPEADELTPVQAKQFKPIDFPNPIDYKRLEKREELLVQGRFSEAAALAKTGSDKILVILVEFAGTDIVTWNPGDIWDPVGNPDPDDADAGDCSNIITQTTQFTYTGPLHNQLPRPPSVTHRAYNTIWTDDFSQKYFWDLVFGDGIYSQYTTVDGTPVTIDLRGYSVRQYFEEQSKGMYTIEGDVVGWVQVPHSEAWYGADACPGARSYGNSGLSDGYMPGGSSPRGLVKDAIDAVVAAYPDLDWAQYDPNGDGVIDRLMIVHAGYGEEDSPTLLKMTNGEHTIWSHSSSVTPAYDIGSTGLKVGPYVIMPEDGITGVFAHEFAHNLGTVDLYAYVAGEPSSGFWTLMNDDWGGGWPDSAVPPGLDPWHKYLLGWNDPVVLNTMSPETQVVLGQACAPGEGTEDSVIVNLPPQIEQPVAPAGGMYEYYSGKSNYRDAKLTLAAPWNFTTVVSPTLTFKTWYDTEEGWDFGFVQVSTDGGATWTSLSGTTTTSNHDPDCFFIDEMPGYTGYSGGWLDETVDLSAYAGAASVLLRFRYETDPATLGLGWFLDDIKVADGSTVLFSDDAETAGSKWVIEDWVRTDGYFLYPQYYIAEWRNACGFDAGLVSGRYNIKDFGMLLWYRNMKYTDAEVYYHLADGPAFGAKGSCLVVDAHPEPWRYSTSGYTNEVADIYARIQMRDAAFGLRDTQPFQVKESLRFGEADEVFPSRPAVSTFNDSLGYYPGLEYVARGPGDSRMIWSTKQWDASVVVPAPADYGVAPPEYPVDSPLRFGGVASSGGRSGWWWYPTGVGYGGTTGNPGENNYGVHIKVVEEANDLSWGKVVVWNNTDTFLGEMTVDKTKAAPGDVLTYKVHIKDAASVSALATMDIPIPKGTQFVPGSLQGAQFMQDPLARRDMADRGRIVWGGRVGGKVLSTPDAEITYQVKVDPLAVGPITNEAILTIRGGRSYRLAASTKLPWVTVGLTANATVGTRDAIRYKITVKNESGATLQNVHVEATWVGGAYPVWPDPTSWVIPSLGPGATWTKQLTLWTFSLASGQVVTTITVTHPWIETTATSFTTTIVQ